MTDEIGETALLRSYLLGTLNDEDAYEHIETSLMMDDAFGMRISIVEDKLIEDFLDNELTQSENDQFLMVFLAASGRRSHLRLVKNLRTVAKSTGPQRGLGSITKAFRSISAPDIRFALVSLVLVIAGIAIWQSVIPRSDTEQGIALLQTSYSSYRPVQARISGLPAYFPFSETRGENVEPKTSSLRERAQRYLRDASADPTDAAAHHGLGLYYLIERDLEKAQRELQVAVSLDPDNARFQSDVGVVYLEKAKNSAPRSGEPAKLELLNESLKHFNLAVAIDSRLAEGYFGQALVLAELSDFEEAKASWKKYLEIDGTSKWADEARQNLKRLEELSLDERSSVDLKSDFLQAHQDRDEEMAGRILATNRELIREKYIPLLLAMEITGSPPDSRGSLLEALKFSGAIEKKAASDPFANEIARFYMSLSEYNIAQLRVAHGNMRLGYKLCLDQDFGTAGTAFGSARDQFTNTGDIWEAKIAEYFLGYSLINSDQNEAGMGELIKVARFADERNFLWLQATARYWLGGGYVKSRQHTKALREFEQALTLAEKVGDPYAVQRNSLELANRHSYAGQHRESLRYLNRALAESGQPNTSSRQRYRTLVDGFVILSAAGLFDAARPMTLEATAVADRLNDPVWRSQARGFAATASAQVKDFAKARELLVESKALAESIGNSEAKQRVIAFSNLRLADIELYEGNLELAEIHYSEAVQYYDSVDMPLNREEARNGLLMIYLALGRTAELEHQIPLNIKFVEDYRARIQEESHRSSFLGRRSDIYDIATSFEFSRGNLERAYEYTEMSSSRALLDWMSKGTPVAEVDNATRGVILTSVASVASLKRIREAMSDNVQIIQYSVLEDKLLIWLISKKKFLVKEVSVSASELTSKINEFRRIILTREEYEADDLKNSARFLYDLLIAPVRADIDPNLELCIIPNKSLFGLPLSALRSPDGKPLLAEMRLLFSPSASVFLHASETASRKSQIKEESILSVGNPMFDRDDSNGLPYMPDAESEAVDVAKNYQKATVLLNQKAERSKFLSALRGSEIIHFSGHYVAVAGVPSASYLLLASDEPGSGESRITNLELAQIELPRAKLVVLSACMTAGELSDKNEGILGLSRTMLAVDSPLTIGSQWPVDSIATAAIMRRFHYLRKHDGMTSTAALRQAQLDLMNDETGKYRAPFYWSAFAVFGGHANF